jgi:hypothetical protein
MPTFNLQVTLTDNTVYLFTQKLTFDQCKSAIEEMVQEAVFTLPTLAPVTFVPFLRVVKIELIPAP